MTDWVSCFWACDKAAHQVQEDLVELTIYLMAKTQR